ncbi:hypothetical protein [Lentzea kentuckyensis]|uniref:hypothetical protein n=1 Tax=Lentzea kentuckyensis TaxID=360086 RepID=UPI000A38AA6F|nr:hypothetical protein [Lentzea kentuckyensis]
MNITPEIPQLDPIRVQARKHALLNEIGQQPARRGWRHAMPATALAAVVVIGAVWWMSPAPITLTDGAAVDRCQDALGRMRMPVPGPGEVNSSVADRRGDVVLVMLTGPESMWFCIFEGESWTSAHKFPRLISTNVEFVAYLGDVIEGKRTGMAYGRVRPDARTATLEIADGRKVPVLLDQGWAVTWWPSSAEAKLLTLYDEAGHVLETVVPENR